MLTLVRTIVSRPIAERGVTAMILAIGLTLAFYATDFYMSSRAAHGATYWHPAIGLDDMIPFRASWIWIYFLYFPLCFLPLAFKKLWQDIGVFRRTALGFVLQFSAALAMFWVFPSQMIRPEILPVDLTHQAVAWFYRLDPGFNIFPSLHVANSTFVACLAWRLNGRAAGGAVWILVALIAASTVLVKQHYFLDLWAGLFLGAFCYRFAFSQRFNALDSQALPSRF